MKNLCLFEKFSIDNHSVRVKGRRYGLSSLQLHHEAGILNKEDNNEANFDQRARPVFTDAHERLNPADFVAAVAPDLGTGPGRSNSAACGPQHSDLFAEDETVAIPGLRYQQDFLSPEEEARLLDVVRTLPLQPAEYKEYLARRQVGSFGGSYDFDNHTLRPGKILDERLEPLRDWVASWMGVPRDSSGPGGRVRSGHFARLSSRRARLQSHCSRIAWQRGDAAVPPLPSASAISLKCTADAKVKAQRRRFEQRC